MHLRMQRGAVCIGQSCRALCTQRMQLPHIPVRNAQPPQQHGAFLRAQGCKGTHKAHGHLQGDRVGKTLHPAVCGDQHRAGEAVCFQILQQDRQHRLAADRKQRLRAVVQGNTIGLSVTK